MAAVHAGIVLVMILRRKRISLLDTMMLSLMLAGYFFVGYFSYQPSRYFLVLVIPVVYFAAALPARIQGMFARKQVGRAKTNAIFASGITCMLVLCANNWHMVRLGEYVSEYRYTIRDTSMAMKQAILKDRKDNGFAGCCYLRGRCFTVFVDESV